VKELGYFVEEAFSAAVDTDRVLGVEEFSVEGGEVEDVFNVDKFEVVEDFIAVGEDVMVVLDGVEVVHLHPAEHQLELIVEGVLGQDDDDVVFEGQGLKEGLELGREVEVLLQGVVAEVGEQADLLAQQPPEVEDHELILLLDVALDAQASQQVAFDGPQPLVELQRLETREPRLFLRERRQDHARARVLQCLLFEFEGLEAAPFSLQEEKLVVRRFVQLGFYLHLRLDCSGRNGGVRSRVRLLCFLETVRELVQNQLRRRLLRVVLNVNLVY